MGVSPVSKYVFLTVVVALLVLGFAILLPYATAIVFGLVFAYIFSFLHERFRKKINPSLSAILICLLVIGLVALPAFLAATQLAQEVTLLYKEVRSHKFEGTLLGCTSDTASTLLCRGEEILYQYVDQSVLDGYLNQAVRTIVTNLVSGITEVILGIPVFLVSVFVMVLIMFYALRDGKHWMKTFRNIIPLQASHRDEMIKYTDDVLFALLYGQIITALVQATIGFIGLLIFQIEKPLLLGVLMAFTALIPLLGAWLVWLPITLLMIARGILAADDSLLGRGIGLALYCAVFVSLSDNLIRPYIVSGRAPIHPLVVLIGVFGGISLFGIAGVILGPLFLSLLVVAITLYARESGIIHHAK